MAVCVCVCVSGVHWLGTTFWMVSQQTDIIRSTSRWRLFNLVLGAIYVFLFLNVKYGQSRCRMIGFYVVCVFRRPVHKCVSGLSCWKEAQSMQCENIDIVEKDNHPFPLHAIAGHVYREHFPASGLLVDVHHGVLGHCGNPSGSVL